MNTITHFRRTRLQWRRHPCGHLPRGIISDASRGGRQSTLEMRNDCHCRSRLLRARGLTDLGLAVNLSCKCARKDVPTFPPILSIDYPQFIRTSTIGESKWLTSLAAVVLSGGEGNYEFVEVRSSPRTLLCLSLLANLTTSRFALLFPCNTGSRRRFAD